MRRKTIESHALLQAEKEKASFSAKHGAPEIVVGDRKNKVKGRATRPRPDLCGGYGAIRIPTATDFIVRDRNKANGWATVPWERSSGFQLVFLVPEIPQA